MLDLMDRRPNQSSEQTRRQVDAPLAQSVRTVVSRLCREATAQDAVRNRASRAREWVSEFSQVSECVGEQCNNAI